MQFLPSEELSLSLLSFRNTKNHEIQEFLQSKAIMYENRRICSTYIVADADALKHHILNIEGYFTLSHKVLELDSSLSNQKRKKLFHGFNKSSNAIPVVLIGQLGKYIDDQNKKYGHVTGTELLDEAFSIIYQVSKKIVCTCIMLECEEADNLRLHQFYQDYGFYPLQKRAQYIQYIFLLHS